MADVGPLSACEANRLVLFQRINDLRYKHALKLLAARGKALLPDLPDIEDAKKRRVRWIRRGIGDLPKFDPDADVDTLNTEAFRA
jgi:hypothetical protein